MNTADRKADGHRMLEDEIRNLEERLLDPAIRRSADALHRLLSDDFIEFGSSGQVYTRAQVIATLTKDPRLPPSVVEEFRLLTITSDVVLATYRWRKSLRSSLWRRDDGNWKLVFHQGTPIPLN